jgi:Ser/Thr protein kinase RdoA (MazF antagonist)
VSEVSDTLLDAVEAAISAWYLPAAPCRVSLLRSYTNDVFLVTSESDQLIVKVYGVGWRTDGELRYEVDLLEHLAVRGIAVARPIRGRDGAWIHHVETSAGRRQLLAFDVAPGAKPVQPFTPSLYRAIGRAAGRMHAALDDFVSPHARAPLDTEHLIDRSLERLAPFLEQCSDDWAFLTDIVARVKAEVLACARDGLDWGVCHGDLTLDNLHLTDDGEVVFYDFDDGGPGWRALEFQGVYLAQREGKSGVWDAYLQGYRSVRNLSESDVRAIPRFVIADQIWSMGVDADRRLPSQAPELRTATLTRQLVRLRSLVVGS